MAIHAVVFDAYGTLFDVYSVETACEAVFPGSGKTLSRMWRAKQLEYTWLRSLMARYEDFETITRDALRHAVKALQLQCDETDIHALVKAYRCLNIFPDVREALPQLEGRKLAILSNGAPEMLNDLVENAGLRHHFTAVLSVHPLKLYKPHRSVYQMAVDRLQTAAADVAFISSNYWDVAGATAFGFHTCWINRSQAVAEELGLSPAKELTHLGELLDVLG